MTKKILGLDKIELEIILANKKMKQAGAELGQAQRKLELV